MEAAYDEVEILQKVAKNINNPQWIDSLKEYHKDEVIFFLHNYIVFKI